MTITVRAVLAHDKHCADLVVRLFELADMTAIDRHGDPGPELDRCVAERPLAARPPLPPTADG